MFAAMAAWEKAAPRRTLSLPRVVRWPGNLGVTALNPILMFCILSVTPLGLAELALQKRWGLLHSMGFSGASAFVLTVVALDMIVYLQHVMFHAVPLLWRLHRMHHADLDFDFTTGARFHPLEILISTLIKIAAVAALGASVAGVVAFEVILNATSMFNHGNVAIPEHVDRWLRRFVVTPDMHRVHHSIERDETNSNFGFNLPWWDWIFGTYRAQPGAGHRAMTIGLTEFRDPGELRLDRMLWQPIRPETAGYPIVAGCTAKAG